LELRRHPADAAMSRSSARGAHALGVDGAGALGWVGVTLDGHGFVAATVDRSLAALVVRVDAFVDQRGGHLDAVGVDMPVGLVDGPRRRADQAARAFVGSRRNSVFWAPHRSVLDLAGIETGAVDHAAANRHLAGISMPKMSAQAWRLVPRIAEATELAAADARLVEVFPEASFRQLADADLPTAKRTAGGALHRLALLAGADPPIRLPADPISLGDAGAVALDDLFDAAACAWSAWRVATGAAFALGERGERDPVTGHRIAVWV
jgi:predicted RNase H-like nuclease